MGSTEEIPVGLEKVFRIIDENKEAIVDTLKEVVSIPSVSAENKHHDDVKRCIEWTKKVLEQEGLYVDVVSTQNQNVHYGSNSPETPVLQARTAYDVKKNTAMIYAYLDVYPAKKSDGWDTEPFTPEEKHGKVYGRGCAAGKGPLVAWLWVLKAFNLAGVPLPVNLRFVIDSTREIGSKATTTYIESKMNRYFYFSTHSVVLADGSWLEENRPSVSCALRGLCYFEIDVTCAGHDLHSGVYGGTISEGMSDVICLLNSLTDEDGCISVPGFCEKVADLTDDEKWTLINARVDMEALRKEMGVPQLIAKEKAEVLKRMWHCPSLSIHGIQGAYSGSGEKAVIPGHVIGKFSIRTAPIQKSEDVRDCITRHLESEFAKRNSPNRLKVTMTTSCEPWSTYRSTANFRAARAAVKQVYGVAPSMTRSGSSLPVATTLSDRVNMNVIPIPISAASGYVVNEHIPIEDLVRGAKLYAAYCYEVSKFP